MSYALTRRFAWIYVDVPADASDFVRKYIAKERGITPPAEGSVPLAEIWSAVNEVRAIGPAPIIDIIKLIEAKQDNFDFFATITTAAQAEPYLDGFSAFILPMMDGILKDEGAKLAESLVSVLKLEGKARTRLETRLSGLTI
jgi:hypothetical protein